MTEMRVMAAAALPDRKYVPPRTGILHLGVMDGFTRKEKFSVISSCDADYAKQVSASDSSLMLGFAMNNSKIRLGEAISMFHTMFQDGGARAHILAKLVVKMANPADAKKLVMKITKGDKTQLSLLKNAMGGAYKPFLGVINGYYELDLRKEMDSIALSRLLEASQGESTLRMAQSPLEMGRMGDTSQCGTWTSFRNEAINGKRFAVTAERFRPMPKSGKITFDFSSIMRPVVNEDLLVITDARLVKILHNQFLVQEQDMAKCMKRLMLWRKHLKRANSGKGHMLPMYEYDKDKGMGIAEAIKEFYQRLDERGELYNAGAERESVKVDYKTKRKDKKKKRRRRRRKKAAGAGGGDDASVTSLESAEPVAPAAEAAEEGDEDDEEWDGEGEEPDWDALAALEGDEDEEEDNAHLDYGGKKLTEDMAKHRMLL